MAMAKRLRLDNEAVKKELECPVCKAVPRDGPIYACPNEHLVCQRCKRETCPVCRVAMGQNRSRLAVNLIEKIHHNCKYDQCDEVFKLDELSDHEQVCKHRSVKCKYDECDEVFKPDELFDHEKGCEHRSVMCPGLCDKKLALSELVEHLESSILCYSPRVHTNANREIKDMYFVFTKRYSDYPVNCMGGWGLLVFSLEGVEFVLHVKKSEDFYSINIVMFETEEECAKYNIEMEVFKPNSPPASRHSVRFRGCPTSIDKSKSDIEKRGLLVHREVIKKMALIKDDTVEFTVSLSFF